MVQENKKAKIFHEKMENNKWYNLEEMKNKPNCLSEVKEAKNFFQEYSVLDKEEMKQIISYKGFVHYYPWNIEVITGTDGKKRGKHKKTGKDYNYNLGLPLTAETFLEYIEELEDLEKEIERQKENNPKEFICGCPKDYYQQKLSKCEDWEVNKKKKLEEIIAGDKCPGMCQGDCKNLVCTKMDVEIFTPCHDCHQSVVNEYKDKKPHTCKDNPAERERERERERESILSYFKQNNIKSITMKNNKLIIKYNDREEEKEINNQELQQINSYLTKLGKNQLSLSDLEQSNSQQPNKTSWTPYILGGIGIIALVGIIGYFLVKRNKKE